MQPLSNNGSSSNNCNNFRDFFLLNASSGRGPSFSWRTPTEEALEQDEVEIIQGRRTAAATPDIGEEEENELHSASNGAEFNYSSPHQEEDLETNNFLFLARRTAAAGQVHNEERFNRGFLRSILAQEQEYLFPSSSRMTCLDIVTEALRIVEANDETWNLE